MHIKSKSLSTPGNKKTCCGKYEEELQHFIVDIPDSTAHDSSSSITAIHSQLPLQSCSIEQEVSTGIEAPLQNNHWGLPLSSLLFG